MIKNKLFLLISFIFFFLIFRSWFFIGGTISSGDWPYFYQQASQSFSITPAYYKAYWGLGETKVIFTMLESYFQWSAKMASPFLPWEISDKLFWFFPFLLVSFFSAKIFTKSIFGGLIYATNTYILMVVSGGQMGVALSYAFVPLVIHSWNDLIDSQNISHTLHLYKALIVGIVLSLQVFFDPRIALLSSGIAALYYLYQFFVVQKKMFYHFKSILYSFFLPATVTLLLHSAWILPMLVYRVGPSDHDSSGNYSTDALDFFSFSDFSHTLSLLHPNWPENIFGKVYFMQPEFLIVPLLAFSALFLLQKNIGTQMQADKRKILFFAIIGLLGAFLAKGVNEPFGEIYGWLFRYVPGFVVFRDPTKFMLLIALSYAYIIPKTADYFSGFVGSILQKRGKQISPILFPHITLVILVLVWGILIRQALMGEIGGTLQSSTVPKAYRSLAVFLTKDPSFFRVLWIPTHQRFGYYGNDHPAISASEFFHTSSTKKILGMLSDPQIISLLSDSSVKYVIVPFDSQGEIFLTDRKYDEKKFASIRREMQKIHLIKRVASFDAIDVYEIPAVKDHIWIDSDKSVPKTSIVWKQLSPTRYSVSVDGHKGDTVVFSENFSRFWRLKERRTTQAVSIYRKILVGYTLKNDGQVELEFYHVFETIMPFSIALSLTSLGVLTSALIILRRRIILSIKS